mgnify:CR=1 FL=1
MNQQQDKIVTHRENRTTHYHLRRRGYGRLQPLTDDQVHQLRLQGVPIDLPVTAPLISPDAGRERQQ